MKSTCRLGWPIEISEHVISLPILEVTLGKVLIRAVVRLEHRPSMNAFQKKSNFVLMIKDTNSCFYNQPDEVRHWAKAARQVLPVNAFLRL